jgi:hypothetical protein
MLIKLKRAARKKAQFDEQNMTNYNNLAKKVGAEIFHYKSKKWRDFCNRFNSLSVSDSKLWNAIKAIDSRGKLNFLA